MGLKRLVYLGIILAALSLASQAQLLCDYGAGISVPLIGVEDPTNLYQFMTPCKVWLSAASGTVLPMVGQVYPVYSCETGTFYIRTYDSIDKTYYGGTCPTSGTEVVAVCDYAEGSGTTAQRGYYVARVVALNSQFPVGTAVGVVEVPPVTAVNNAGTVTITWSAVPSNTAVAGYRVVRSADGITDWSTVGDTTDLSKTDTPGAGTWYYAVLIRYTGTPTTYVSNHGLAASVVVE